MRKVLERNIFIKDADGEPRKFVLVGHGILTEIGLMQGIKVNLQDAQGFLGVLDTMYIGKNVLIYPFSCQALTVAI